MAELKPCPFCGSFAVTTMDECNSWRWEVYCARCNAAIGFFETEEEAIEAWNRRTENVDLHLPG